MPTFPLFALFDPALGMSAVIPDMDATRPAAVKPENIIEPILRHGVTNMFGSPALIDKVGRYGEAHGVKLPSLKRAISAGAPMPARVLERFSKMLSREAQVFTPYGATESLPVCSIGSAEVLAETREKTDQGAGVCVGRPVNGMTVEVIRINDEPIEAWSEALRVPRGEVGEIAVKGPVVTRSYFNREAATKLAKIAVFDSAEFYHRMGDLGYFDDEGRLWFCGRKSHRVVTRDETYYTIPCEGVFNAHPKVYRSALVGAERSTPVEHVEHVEHVEPVLVVELETDARESQGTSPGAVGARCRPAPYERNPNAALPQEPARRHPPQLEDLPREARRVGHRASPVKALVTGGGGFLGGAIATRSSARVVMRSGVFLGEPTPSSNPSVSSISRETSPTPRPCPKPFAVWTWSSTSEPRRESGGRTPTTSQRM